MLNTPYRKGRDAARQWYEDFKAWQNRCREAKSWSEPRPEKPKNPYPLGRSRNCGCFQWNDGFEWEVRSQERIARGGNKISLGTPRRGVTA